MQILNTIVNSKRPPIWAAALSKLSRKKASRKLFENKEQGGKHNLPHIHAEYSGQEVVVALDGTILEGERGFPKNKLKMLKVWMDIHHEGP